MSIVTEMEITALALQTAHALNTTHDFLSLLNEEVYQLRKVALENCVALNMLTAIQGRVCDLVVAECCVCLPDALHNVSQALWALAAETCAIGSLTSDLLQERWVSLMTEWQWVLAVLGGCTCVLVACCCSLYCCCGLWVQGSALLAKGSSWKTP